MKRGFFACVLALLSTNAFTDERQLAQLPDLLRITNNVNRLKETPISRIEFGVYKLKEELHPLVGVSFKKFDGTLTDQLLPLFDVQYDGGRIIVIVGTRGESSDASCREALGRLDSALLILSHDIGGKLSRAEKLSALVDRLFLPPGDLLAGMSRKEAIAAVIYLIDVRATIYQNKDNYMSCERGLLSDEVYVQHHN